MQTTSDPMFNSNGYETRHSSPYKDGEIPAIVEYPVSTPETLDDDIKDSQAH